MLYVLYCYQVIKKYYKMKIDFILRTFLQFSEFSLSFSCVLFEVDTSMHMFIRFIILSNKYY
jgi:hypothetical protein